MLFYTLQNLSFKTTTKSDRNQPGGKGKDAKIQLIIQCLFRALLDAVEITNTILVGCF
jgi:hypothetical protein